MKISKIQESISKAIEEKISGEQRRYLLNEQLKAIKKELGLETGMNKSWLNIKDRGNITYIRGVDHFLEWAFTQHGVTNEIRCPCKKCRNVSFKVKTDVRADLLIKGFWDSYKLWDLHGEASRYRSGCETSRRVVENDTYEDENFIRMVCDAYGVPRGDDMDSGLNDSEEPNAHTKRFFDLLKDAEKDLYPGCNKISKLSFIVKLLQLKCLNHWTNKSMDSLLDLLKFVLPDVRYKGPHYWRVCTPDQLYMIQHTRKKADGQLEWADPQSEQIYANLQDLRQQQEEVEVDSRMTSDEILTAVLGERSGLLKVRTINCYHMGGTIVLMLIEALLILLALLISKAIKLTSPSLYGDQLAVDASTKDDVTLTQMASLPSSHIVVSPSATKYDVFLSFRGEDTRQTFASSLYEGLCKKGIHTFMDNKLRKGEPISQVLLRTIEESEISMIIFSENYTSSTWCLDELIHILECKEKFGRVVIPIFYNIDPSNIRKQNGSFEKGFNELKRRFESNPEKPQKWINALVKASNLSGWDFKNARPEFKLIEEIVKDILSKLKYESSCDLEGLVGIARHIRNIENLLTKARIVGIWGMGGAGKTTLSKAIFQELRAQFDAFSFIENVKEQLKKISLDELQQNCLKEVLKDKDISIYDIKSTSVKKRLGRKKVLIILDDVDVSRIAGDLTKVLYWCGEGSRIIITSRDMQVLQNAYEQNKPRSTQATYHVPDLDFDDAIHLFSLKAFKQYEPSEGYMELSKSVVKYCKGNPLALVVLGCYLYGREKEEWENALEKLDKDPPKDIVDILKLSFDGLDEKQQNVFLDLAFLINERIDISLKIIIQLYESSALIEISVLKEKSLISFINDCHNHCPIVMHDLVKKMGLKIARNQLISDAKTPIRLWRHEDIADFFSRGKAIEAIRCMSLDVSMMKSITLRASIFRKIRNLTFLKIYKSDWRKPSMLNIHGVLDYLSEELSDVDKEERGDREMMNEHQLVTMSLIEDDEEDDVLIEDWSIKSVTFTRVPNSITRWSLLKELTIKLLPLSHKYWNRIKPCIELTLSFPDIIPPSASPLRDLIIIYDLDRILQRGFKFYLPVHISSILKLAVLCEGIYNLDAWIQRKRG
ncbi:hypothetical protein K1719_001805 [Acacia pycnantha]|nr:hypothetical protein K1719_001805 [Acacia pycnantha]